ncbi:uncharacterized protein LOC141907504 [Tubulanus polymorphus]|uniref:uncharacterized protein LOC141907504 n=1 Tax=Tubulanus polymorphus TaxID=672921 RepID=UPI003DA5EA8B
MAGVYDQPTNAAIAGTLICFVVIPSLLLNSFLISMFAKRKRLQVPVMYFLISLATSDIIGVVIWCLPTVIAALGFDYLYTDVGLCQTQVITWTFHQTLNSHTFVILTLERCLKFWNPNLHSKVFYNDIVVIMMIVGHWIFELVCALFPLMGWGTPTYYPRQLQCNFNNPKMPSHLNAMFFYTFCVPFLFMIIVWPMIATKYRQLTAKVAPWDDSALAAQAESYGGNLAADSKKSPVRKGRGTKAVDEDDWSEDELYSQIVALRPYEDYDGREYHKHVYKYRMREYYLAVTIFVAWLIFLLCWLIFISMTYMQVYQATNDISSGVYVSATWWAMFTLACKPVFYFIVNPRFRWNLRKALNCQPFPQKKPKPAPATHTTPRIREDPVYAKSTGPQNQNIYRHVAPGLDYKDGI